MLELTSSLLTRMYELKAAKAGESASQFDSLLTRMYELKAYSSSRRGHLRPRFSHACTSWKTVAELKAEINLALASHTHVRVERASS